MEGGGREGWKNEAVNGAPCHWRYGKKHRMNWKNERKVQKGAEGKEETGLTTCLSLALSLNLTLFLLLPFLPTGRIRGGRVHWSCLATDMFLERKCCISRILSSLSSSSMTLTFSGVRLVIKRDSGL